MKSVPLAIIIFYKEFEMQNAKGQGLVEYALIIVLVSIVVIAALTILGPRISAVFNMVSDTLSAV
jgi:pilus assembly protein Flp/PilA